MGLFGKLLKKILKEIKVLLREGVKWIFGR
jgi:hypothetical protein